MRKRFEELEFKDSFLFAATMEDEEICRMVLERVLEIPILAVKTRSENAFLFNSDYRGVRLDVFADDGEGTVFDVEMQTTDRGNLPKRSRLYQAQMDVGALRPGEDFSSLPDSFIIFLCTFDPFGRGSFRYTFESRCLEDGIGLEDGACRVFLNTEGVLEESVSADLVRFLRYVGNSSLEGRYQEDPLIRKISGRIAGLKRSRRMEERYMLFSEMLEDERNQGIRAGEKRILKLLERMEADGLSAEIPRLLREPEFLAAMYARFHLDEEQ